jgi:mRNA interferase HicA
VKKRELEKHLRNSGCVLLRHGGKHDWWHNPQTKISQAVPRHAEINEHVARQILKMLGEPKF